MAQVGEYSRLFSTVACLAIADSGSKSVNGWFGQLTVKSGSAANQSIICSRMGKDTRRYLFFAFFVALISGGFCLGNEETVGPESLLAQARKLQAVGSDGTPAVKVQTDIEIVDAKGKTTPGQYLVTWISPSRWREELEIGNY